MTYDIAGDVQLKRTQFLPVADYHKSLSDNYDDYISVALMGGAVRRQFYPSQAKLDDQFVNGVFSANNPTRQLFSNTGFTYWDLSQPFHFQQWVWRRIEVLHWRGPLSRTATQNQLFLKQQQ